MNGEIQDGGSGEAAAGGALSAFIRSLGDSGRVTVRLAPLPIGERVPASIIEGLDARAREEVGGVLPMLDVDAAAWSARLLHDLCQCAACRDLGEGTLARIKESRPPGVPGPERVWSVDLFLRHLPGLWRWARHQDPLDPLTRVLVELGNRWPLSSVGIEGCAVVDLFGLDQDRALMRLYVDRIEASLDLGRLAHPMVEALVRADLVVHRELSPVLAGRVFANL